ncbi:MAG: glycosyltransferase family 39 protein [Fimbriimonadaceae bacterium]|nr:glycosyltransferase family 39 protein [Fimbriimonadaceae bacterium]
MRPPNWVIVLACIVPFLGWWAYGLFDLDEGFYAAVVSDMLRRGDWITPTYNGVPWFEKPILAYWLAMPSVLALGPEWGPRLPSVLCTLLTAWMLSRFALQEYGKAAGQVVPIVYCSSLLPLGLGRMMMTDAPLVAAMTGGLLATWGSVTGARGSLALSRSLAGLAIGLAVLAKGPVGLVLFTGILILLAWVDTEARPRLARGWWWFLSVFLAVVSAWYVPCFLANGQAFVQEFLIEQNVGRFTGGDRSHSVPPWAHPVYYPVILAAGLLPFWPFVARKFLRREQRADGFLLVWAVVVLAFFTMSGTKLPHYVLPAAPPLAVLIGRALASKLEAGFSRGWGWLLGWPVAACALANAVFYRDWDQRMREVQSLARYASGKGAGLVVYRIGREGDPGTGGLELQETSHPSVLFYYRGLTTLTDEEAALDRERLPFFVLTRAGRWNPPSGWGYETVPIVQDKYRLYLVKAR